MIREEIKKLIEKSIKELQKDKKLPKFDIPEIKIEHPEEKVHGDYSTNVAMVIAKLVRKNPIEIAKLINWKLEIGNWKFLNKIEAVEPGFINFFLSNSVLTKELKIILKEKEKYGSSKVGKGKTVIIDYSSPNIAKPFGIGHLRSTIIGQALYNIYKFLGWKCIGDNHLGDWGTQFGKLIVAIKKWRMKDFSVRELENLYVKFHKEAEKNPKLEEEARREFKNLEKGEKTARKTWKKCVEISLKEFDKVYKLIGIKIDYALGESFYQGMFEAVVQETIKKEIALKSQGALVIKYPKDKLPPAMLLKSDGATTYLTRDLATVKYRLKKWKPDLIIYEVGADQKLHLKQLFEAVELLGWAKRTEFFHVAHGLYRTKTGKFSTRKGKTIHLEEVLKEAIEKTREIIEKSETGQELSKEEKEKIAKIVGIGAVKYNDLFQHYSKDIIFDWDKILNLKGNSAPYLQYTFARCQSVLKKAKLETEPEKVEVLTFNKEEKDILREIYKFPEIVKEAADRFSSNLICNFIFDLAQKYNLFYNLHSIIKAQPAELKIFRLTITACVAQVLKNTLNLIGISAPEKM
ncbi:MAG: arginine--tRNA ligase [Candidatus Nealsonbacteria bacterium]|nr:arginine--tRNA ligase [Candidatus Nealsonbacteria bacterium]